MKNKILYAVATALIIGLQSCGNYRDGRLLADKLTSSSGKLNFAPMQRSDSASVADFKPDTLFYKGKPYTGAIGEYNNSDTLILTGFAKNGLMDSTWKFYYGSGVLMMEGKYRNGFDIGFWRSYYTRNKPNIEKLYDDKGYMLMRIEYYDNGKVKNYQNVKSPVFGDQERHYDFSREDTNSIYFQEGHVILNEGNETKVLSSKIL
jgi:antitoxin component YwqK of YwqJK toxin-antitoxin module